MNVRWIVLSAMLSVAGMGQVAEAKKGTAATKEAKEIDFTGAEVKAQDGSSVGVSKAKLQKNKDGRGDMSVVLVVTNKGLRPLKVKLDQIKLSAADGTHLPIWKGLKKLKSSTMEIKPSKNERIEFEFEKVDANMSEAKLELSAALGLTMDNLTLTKRGAASGAAGSEGSPSGGETPSEGRPTE
jgi:hypothetical protein